MIVSLKAAGLDSHRQTYKSGAGNQIMEKLQQNSLRKLYNKNKFLFVISFIFVISFRGFSQTNGEYTDRFYKTVDSIIECKKQYNFKDTITFIQKALYSYRNNQVSYYFDSFLKCYEPTYENKLKGESGIPTLEITTTYGLCDKKYILLFYSENYLLNNILKRNPIPDSLNVYSTISLKNIRTGKSTVMGKENDYKNLKIIYKKLLMIYNNKKLLKKLLYIKKTSPLEYIGYVWQYD